MADLEPREKFGSSCKILENRYGVQNFVIIFPIYTTRQGRNHRPDTSPSHWFLKVKIVFFPKIVR
jgi:hypothetical protein